MDNEEIDDYNDEFGDLSDDLSEDEFDVSSDDSLISETHGGSPEDTDETMSLTTVNTGMTGVTLSDHYEADETPVDDCQVREIVVIDPSLRRTSNILTQAEQTELIGERAEQISRNATVFVDIGDLTDPISIAKKEFYSRMCPLMLRRTVGYKRTDVGTIQYVEVFDVNLMQIQESK